MTDIKKFVGTRIKESRKQKHLTQREVAFILNMTQQQYSRFENGVFELDYTNLIAISKLYEVSLDYLFGLTDF